MSPFHSGELAVQRRTGQDRIAERVGRMIRAEIPAVAADFLVAQPMIVLGAADPQGRVWAGQLAGPPGFVRAVDDETLCVDAEFAPGDPLRAALRAPARIGVIALEPQRRRRMRLNGRSAPVDGGLRIATDQVYSNCPKYIARRRIESYDPSAVRYGSRTAELDPAQQAAIAAADTFFVASADAAGNVDASHRGGNPGFVQVLSATRLRWPDYQGNSMFMTLGNLAVDPRCGLLIPDWSTGTVLQLTGTAELNWDSGTFARGSQCSIDFTVTGVVESRGPLRWGSPELSPVNPPVE
ncbi:pyridoxamine 5'-phosphate oxidase family protein [Nocardia sp. NPDC127579]|uniref:pyridoxamine 5'-phosphate oxidase family protein n=1 Tax=Nocardia sp. NPDC127579 TaxID=3345402 RepID=UPI00363CFCA4